MADLQALKGQSALVTGGAGGIGAACAARLAEDGAAVTLMGRRQDKLEQARAAILDRYPEAEVALCVGDALQEADTVRAAQQAFDLRQRLDIVVPTVGGGGFMPLMMQSLEGLMRELELNIGSAFLAIRHCAPLMDRGGSIVCISSTTAAMPFPWLSAYCAGKAGLEGLIRSAADELASAGIRINAVRPGLTRSEATGPMFASAGTMAAFNEQIPLGRTGEGEDIAEGVRYLAGPESSWVTGQCYNIDGGQGLRRHPDMTEALAAAFGEDALAAITAGKPFPA
ncbi:SDR family NAD(P)-dependent oxidoreductase [Parahaliea aestuarii]|uniref:SDR family oxidoreductase n=1 Tax=Parahaliea aestuarii TaxID=1852021 RepID=A0A5C9A384_9GAMM|nr:SDR family oxidoreductase [Parahaliea aestuarii]TXS94464.1 SDR family oxidoreductase [Parahaliea aestuarii]